MARIMTTHTSSLHAKPSLRCDAPARDAVALAIEKFLQNEAVHGYGPFQVREHPDQITASFSRATVSGETRDIALIRLARALLDNARLRPGLTKLLHGMLTTP